MKKILITCAMLLLAVVFVITIPLSYEYSLGDQTLPDSAMYEMEIIGESFKCGVTLDRSACLLSLADERDSEASQLKEKRNTILDTGARERYEFMIVAAQNAAARLRMEALGR